MQKGAPLKIVFEPDKMDSHVLWSSSTKRAMEIISRHPNGDHVRLETQSRSAGTSSSSQSSWADLTEEENNSVVDGPQSDFEQVIPTEREYVVYGGAGHLTREQLTVRSAYGGAHSETGKRLKPLQHMWWYEGDDDQSSSLFSSSAGDGPSFISGDECEEESKVANKKKASKESTGAQTVAQGSNGAKTVSRIRENRLSWRSDVANLQAVARRLGSESGSVCQQQRAEKPIKQKKPELHQKTKQDYSVRECVITDIVSAILTSPGPNNSDSDEEQVQPQKQQGKADGDFSRFNALSPEELMSVVPLSEEGRPTTIGSMMHATGACKPCVFATTSSNCQHGIYCQFCHLKHNSKSRTARRMRMRSRDKLRKNVDTLCQQVESDLSLDLDTFEMPPSLFHWADVVKTRLRIYQQGLRTQQLKLSL